MSISWLKINMEDLFESLEKEVKAIGKALELLSKDSSFLCNSDLNKRIQSSKKFKDFIYGV